MCGTNAIRAQGSGCMFTLCHAPLKMAVLLHKTGNVCRVMITAVYTLCHTANILTVKITGFTYVPFPAIF